MTQLYLGHKPGVGPVVKVLKYNSDDPLTLANTAYDRYYFNSETQKLTYVRDVWNLAINFWSVPDTGSTATRPRPVASFFGTGDSATATYTGSYDKTIWSGTNANLTNASYVVYARHKTLFKDVPYIPLPAIRNKDVNGWTLGALRSLSWIYDDPRGSRELGVYYSVQSYGTWFKHTPSTGNGDWNFVPSIVQGVAEGDWVMAGGSAVNPQQGNAPSSTLNVRRDGNPQAENTYAYWDLPADASPMTEYTNVSGLETMRLDKNGFIFTRPGYSVDSSAGTRHRIFDNSMDLATVVMTGVTQPIPAGQTVSIPSNLNLAMDESSIVEIMARNEGQPQYIPAHILSGFSRNNRIEIYYRVRPDALEIQNRGTHTTIVTYFVFNSNVGQPSTGGNEIIMRGSDGGQDYIQIKRPGTTDPASKVKDIILDTRLPTLQIIKEGFIKASEFTDNPENTSLLGGVAKEISFDNSGFIPFVRFSLVFDDRIMPPVMSVFYNYPSLGPPNKFSSLARLENNKVKFWMNPNSWCSRYLYNDGMGTASFRERWFAGQPWGIRYYIFGITR